MVNLTHVLESLAERAKVFRDLLEYHVNYVDYPINIHKHKCLSVGFILKEGNSYHRNIPCHQKKRNLESI